jgi:aspartyl-tRNA(Asn)/glutamyl-tRNA(Gln) amidotransferase subunit C
MKISPEEVKHVADLARLEMTPEEVESMTRQLDGILNAFRDDEVRPSLDREDSLSNAPQQDGESFVVPKVI